MEPIKRSTHNFVYRGPTPDIGDLSCERGGGVVRSHWQPSEEELAVLNEGGSVELGIWGMEPIPPVSLGVRHAE
jgi:hypothetical protein